MLWQNVTIGKHLNEIIIMELASFIYLQKHFIYLSLHLSNRKKVVIIFFLA